MGQEHIHIVGGPTAGGKSAQALALAEDRDGVIINADSMQLYDALPILTAHPTSQDKKKVPHALYGATCPNAPCSAGNWREMAEPLIKKTLEQDKTPIVVGGSGLYIKALMDGLSPIPDIPDHIRKQAADLQQTLGNPGFHTELAKRDPVMAERLHPYHTARLIRAWEVIEATKKSLAEWQKLPRLHPPQNWHFQVTLIIPDKESLYRRCNSRFLRMIETGALEEVHDFTDRVAAGALDPATPINRALGLAPLASYLRGQCSREDAIEKAQQQTRNYAKRQLTWFRHQIKPSAKVTVTIIDGASETAKN